MNLEAAERLAVERQADAVDVFEKAFRKAQDALGLRHYHVSFREYSQNRDGNYAEIDADPESCTAMVEWDWGKCEADGVLFETAAHELAHLLLADFKHAVESNPRAARLEEERLVRRLEPVIVAFLKR